MAEIGNCQLYSFFSLLLFNITQFSAGHMVSWNKHISQPPLQLVMFCDEVLTMQCKCDAIFNLHIVFFKKGRVSFSFFFPPY